MNKAQKKALTDKRRHKQQWAKKHTRLFKKRKKYADAIGHFLDTIISMKHRKDCRPSRALRWIMPTRAEDLYTHYTDELDRVINRLEK